MRSWKHVAKQMWRPQPSLASPSVDGTIPLIRCYYLTKKFGETLAINKLTFETSTSYLGLLGPNGSGKSTLIKMILGLLYPTTGQIKVGYPAADIRVIPDFPVLPHQLTIDQWMQNLENIYGNIQSKIDVEGIMELDPSQRIKDLSAGQYRKVALLPMFYGKPNLIVMDEPTNFLDIIARGRILKLMKEQIKFSNSKIIIASHRLEEIRLFAEEVLVLKAGENLFNASLMEDTALQYTVRVNDTEKLVSRLKKSKIPYKVDETFIGPEVTMQVSQQIWNILQKFTLDGGSIYSFSAKDKMEGILEEMF